MLDLMGHPGARYRLMERKGFAPLKGPPPRHSTLKPPTPVARQGTLVKRSRLRLELTLALMFKVVALTVLWFAFFRPDPDHPRPSPGDLFTRSVPSIDQGVSR